LKEEETKNIDLEESTSLEVKLDVLASGMEEMMQRITARNDYSVQSHRSLIDEDQMANPEHFASYPSCHSDCFVDHLGEERYVDMMMIMFSKQKLILQINQHLVCGRRNFTFSNSNIVINRCMSAMTVTRKVMKILK